MNPSLSSTEPDRLISIKKTSRFLLQKSRQSRRAKTTTRGK
jgi:hypothetical protein